MTICEEIYEPDNQAIAYLESLGLSCKTFAHEIAYTVEEQTAHASSIPGTFTKNLFLRDKKYGLYLLTSKDDRPLNMKAVGKMLNLSGSNLRLADEELLLEKLGVTRGSVSPFALLNDKGVEVKFCIDKALLDGEIINIHPLRNDRSTSVTPAVLLEFLKSINHDPIVLNFDEV